MTDPISSQPLGQINKVEDTSDVAGAANVQASYLVSDVPQVAEISEATGLDGLELSSSISPSSSNQIGIGEAIKQLESPNYIVSTIPVEGNGYDLLMQDTMDMNSLGEIEDASQYITPYDYSVQNLAAQIKNSGILQPGMTPEEMALAVNDYINKNFSYIPEAVADDWYTAQQTIARGGGDCEDLANLEASVLMAMLIDAGMTFDDASKTVGITVLGDINYGIGHVLVSVTLADGGVKYLDPTKAGMNYADVSGNKVILFTYSASQVRVLDLNYRYMNLITGLDPVGLTIPADTFQISDVLPEVQFQEGRLDSINADVWELCNLTTVLAAQALVDYYWAAYQGSCSDYTRASTAYQGTSDWVGRYYKIRWDLGFLGSGWTWGYIYEQHSAAWCDGGSYIDANGTFHFIGHKDDDDEVCEGDVDQNTRNVIKTMRQAEANKANAYNNWVNSVNKLRDTAGQFDYVDPAFINSIYSISNSSFTSMFSFSSKDAPEPYPKLGLCSVAASGNTILGGTLTYTVQKTVSWTQNNTDFCGNKTSTQMSSLQDETKTMTVVGGSRNSDGTVTFIGSDGTTLSFANSKFSFGNGQTQGCYAAKEYYLDKLIDAKTVTSSVKMSDGTYQDITNTVGNLKNTIFKKVDGYFVLNPDAVGPGGVNVFTLLRDEASDVKGLLTMVALLYQAKRDLREFVNQELRAENKGPDGAGYKGMDVLKLFAKKVERTAQSFSQLLQNVLRVMTIANAALFQLECNRINDQFDDRADEIKDNASGFNMFSGGTAGGDWWDGDQHTAENERDRLQALSGATATYLNVVAQNQTAAAAMMSQAGLEAGIDLSGIMGQLSLIEVDTTDASDDKRYREIDEDKVDELRYDIVGAGQQVRIGLMAVETLTNMRNLVHQEMTGVSGRSMRTDVTGMLVEAEQNNILGMFDAYCDTTSQKVQMQNQITYYAINIDKLNEQIDAMNNFFNKALNYIAKGISLVLTVVGAIVGAIFGNVIGFGLGAAIGNIVGGIIGGIFSSMRNLWNASVAYNAEQKHNDVIKPTEYKHSQQTDNTFSSGDSTLDYASYYDRQSRNLVNGMTASTYLQTMNDGRDLGDVMNIGNLVGMGAGALMMYSGSSAVNYGAFAEASDKVSAFQRAIMVLNSIRQDVAQLRNLTHQEMTGIGGRSASNMLTYAMEAARGQLSFQIKLSQSSIEDQNQSRNLQYQRNRNLQQALMNINNAMISLMANIVAPIIGPVLAQYIDLDSKKKFWDEQDDNEFKTDQSTLDHDWDSPELTSLLRDGAKPISGDSKKQYVDIVAVMKAREQATKLAISRSVLASIKKAMNDMRSIVHMEMTGVSSRSGGEMTQQVISAQFAQTLKNIDLIASHLGEKVRITNKNIDATMQKDKYEALANNALTTGSINAVLKIISVIVSFIPMLNVWVSTLISVATTIASVVYSLTNANTEVKFAEKRLKDYEGLDAQGILNAIKNIRKNNPSSTESRLEQLESEILEEIAMSMLSSTGRGGLIGVNRGMAGRYTNALEKAHRADKVMQSLKQSANELRNMVHETMTGIGGISSDSAQTALKMELDKALKMVNDAFTALKGIEEIQNNRADAMKDLARAEKAQAQAQLLAGIQLVGALIQVVMAALQSIGNLKDLKANVDAGKESLKDAKGVEAKASTPQDIASAKAEVTKIEMKLKTDSDTLEVALKPWKDRLDLVKGISIGVELYQIMEAKSSAFEAEHAAQEAAEESGFKPKGVKTSKVVDGKMPEGATTDDMLALLEAESGEQDTVKEQRDQLRKLKDIDRNAQQQMTEWVKNTASEIAGEIKEHAKPGDDSKTVTAVRDGKPEATPAQTAVPSSSVGTPDVNVSNILAALFPQIGAFKDALNLFNLASGKKETPNEMAVEQAMASVTKEMNQSASDVGKDIQQSKTKSSNANLEAYGDKVIAETDKRIATMEPVMASAKAAPLSPAEKALEGKKMEEMSDKELQALIASKKKQLSAATVQGKKMEKEVKALREQLAGMKAKVAGDYAVLESDKKRIDGEIRGLEDSLAEMIRLRDEQKDPALKKLMDREITTLKKDMDAKIATLRRDADLAYAAGKARLHGVSESIKGLEGRLEGLSAEQTALKTDLTSLEAVLRSRQGMGGTTRMYETAVPQ